MTTQPGAWLAAYLYCAEPWEALLTQAVQPFAQQALASGWADSFFFIRYWERGPHIRLRFRGNAPVLESQLRPALTAHFTRYFRQHPSQRTDPARQLPPDQQWFPNDSIQFIPYEPETDRYGGAVGVAIAERQFSCASRVVLATLATSRTWNYDRALGTAIQLHLLFAHATGMDLEEACAFFTLVYTQWAPRAYLPPPGATAPGQAAAYRQQIDAAFATAYARQEETLIPFVRTVWETLREGCSFEQAPLNEWVDDMRAINAQLLRAQADGLLEVPGGLAPGLPAGADGPKLTRWHFFESYVHMLNNRLGILNRDEGYLGFLLKASIGALTGPTPDEKKKKFY